MTGLKSILIGIITMFYCAVLSYAGAGTSGAQFLKIDVDARSVALGGVSSVSEGPSSVFMNPAGLYFGQGTEVNLSQVLWIQDISYSNIAVSHQTGFGALALGINYLSVPAIDKYDNLGTKLEKTYAPTDMALSIGYSRKAAENINAGASIKYISSILEDEKASAFALDIGAQHTFLKNKMLVGLTVKNIGTEIKFIEEADQLPLTAKLGLGYNLGFGSDIGDIELVKCNLFNFLGDAEYINDMGVAGNIGIEYIRNLNMETAIAVRTGYRSGIEGLNSTAGLGAGIGIYHKSYGFDYAFAPYGDLNDTHRLTLGLKF